MKCRIASSKRPSVISTTPTLLCAPEAPPDNASARSTISNEPVEITEQPLVVPEDRPDAVIARPSEIDTAPERDVGAVQAPLAGAGPRRAHHGSVRTRARAARRAAARRRPRRSTRDPSTSGRGCATPATRSARSRRACAGSSRRRSRDPRVAARSRSCCRTRMSSHSARRTRAAAGSNRSSASSTSWRSTRIAPKNCTANSL